MTALPPLLVDGETYETRPVAAAPGLVDVYDGDAWITRARDLDHLESAVRRYAKAGSQKHWVATYRVPDDMPPAGAAYPCDGRVHPEVFALGVCDRCGWVHTHCRGHAKTKGMVPCSMDRARGQVVCKNHGGATETARARAAGRLVIAEVEGTVGALLAEAQLVVEGRSLADQLVNAINEAGTMAQGYRWLLESLPAESEWSFQVVRGEQGAPQRWVNVAEAGLVGPDAKGQMQLHAYEEGYRHWTALHGKLLVEAARLGLDERRQVFAETQVAKISDAITALVAGLGHDLDDPAVVPVVEAALRMIAGDGGRPDGGVIDVGPPPPPLSSPVWDEP